MKTALFPLLSFLCLLLIACSTPAAPPPPTPTLSPRAVQGKQVFTQECARCHSLDPDTVIVGPSLHAIGQAADARVAGQDAESYLLTSILAPESYVVEGFEDLMPSDLAKKLTGEEMDAVVAFLLTQTPPPPK